MTGLKTICVYCGSGPGTDPAFLEAARALGRDMAENGVGLVYGGGNIGLMGALARSVLDHGGQVTSIIPDFLKARERMLDDVQETISVPQHAHPQAADVRARRRLRRPAGGHRHPGGTGRADDVGPARPPHQADLLLSIRDFWKPLLVLIAHMRELGFIRPGLELNYLVAERVEEVLPMLAASARRLGLSSGGARNCSSSGSDAAQS